MPSAPSPQPDPMRAPSADAVGRDAVLPISVGLLAPAATPSTSVHGDENASTPVTGCAARRSDISAHGGTHLAAERLDHADATGASSAPWQALQALDPQLTRRHVLVAGGACAAGVGLSTEAVAQGSPSVAPTIPSAPVAQEKLVTLSRVTLQVNGQSHTLELDNRTSLLDALREHLKLTGTKKGCDHGQCGACTVLLDGRRVNSCLTLAVMAPGAKVTTIEGLGTPDRMHPMQTAFVRHDGYQCGYCTPGQICSAVAVLDEIKAGQPSHVTGDLTARPLLSIDELRERMSGNLCRCGAYSNIMDAMAEVAGIPMPGAAAGRPA